KRKDTQVPQLSMPTESAVDEAINDEICDSLVRATTAASCLEAKQDSGDGPRHQDSIGDTFAHTRYERVSKMSSDSLLGNKLLDDEVLDKEDTSKQRRIDEIDADKDITLVSTYDDVSTQDNIVQDKGIEDVGEEEVVEVVTTTKMIIDAVVDAAQVTTVIADIPVSVVETIVNTATTITAEFSKINVEVQDKGKGKAKLIEELEMPKKRKHQIRADKELAEKLQAEMQAEINEEDRLAREKDQKEQEVNDSLINT
nr:hypothetical protein [Tanacetum cinerariifolium]